MSGSWKSEVVTCVLELSSSIFRRQPKQWRDMMWTIISSASQLLNIFKIAVYHTFAWPVHVGWRLADMNIGDSEEITILLQGLNEIVSWDTSGVGVTITKLLREFDRSDLLTANAPEGRTPTLALWVWRCQSRSSPRCWRSPEWQRHNLKRLGPQTDL